MPNNSLLFILCQKEYGISKNDCPRRQHTVPMFAFNCLPGNSQDDHRHLSRVLIFVTFLILSRYYDCSKNSVLL